MIHLHSNNLSNASNAFGQLFRSRWISGTGKPCVYPARPRRFPEQCRYRGASHTGRLPEAIECFRRASRAQSKLCTDAHYNLALALFSTKQIDEAIPHSQQVVDNPKYSRAYAVLVRALAAKNRSEEAVATAQKGIKAARVAGLLLSTRKNSKNG